VRPEALDDESLEALYPYPGRDGATFRKVRLATAGIAIVDALNWFFPDNFSSDIREQLETSDTPFGRAIRHLNPKRRTFLVRRCTPGQLVDAAQSIGPTAVAFEHRAVVYRDDDVPLAIVHERFRAILAYPLKCLERKFASITRRECDYVDLCRSAQLKSCESTVNT
jgi:chorismate-pyruvate lyase